LDCNLHLAPKSRSGPEIEQVISELIMDAEKAGYPLTGVTKTDTIYEPWSNEKPLDGQVCQISYVLSLSDGTSMESSRERRKDAPFVLGSTDIIEGISMAVRTFGQGERSKVKIASELGYGTSTFVLVSPT